jgi:hypothetical protein
MAFTFFFRDLDAIELIPDYVLSNIPEKKLLKYGTPGVQTDRKSTQS